MTDTPVATSPSVDEADRWVASTAIVGGTAVIVGVALPWLSVLAGLQTLTGMHGANGRILAAGGAIAVGVGAANLRSTSTLVRRAAGLIGFALVSFSSWLLMALFLTYRALSTDPLTLARLGPGLFVATAGAAVVFAPLLRTARATSPRGVGRHGFPMPVALLAASSLLAGVLHLAVSGQHLAGGPATGLAFVALALAQTVGAGLLVLRPSRRLLHAAVALNAGAIVAWALTEAGFLAFLHAHGASGQHGAIPLITVTAEAVVVLVSLRCLTRPPMKQQTGER